MNTTRISTTTCAVIAVALFAASCGSDTTADDTAVATAADDVNASPDATEPAPEGGDTTENSDTTEGGESDSIDDVAALLNQSTELASSDPTVSLLLALEADRREPSDDTEAAILAAMRLNTGVTTEVATTTAVPKCSFPLASDNGEQIYLVGDDRLMRYDIATGEAVDHGAAVDPCSEWVGDVDTDRRAVVDGGRWSLGPLDGPDEVDIDADGLFIAGRSMAGDRIAFVAPEATGLSLLVFDSTTGDLVAEQNGVADPSSLTYGSDGTQLAYTTAVPGAGGQLVVLDAQSGAEIARVDLSASSEESRFDPETGEVLIPTVDGRLLTVDVESGSVVSDVETASDADVVAINVRADGLVVIAREGIVEIVDRTSGPTGVSAPLSPSPSVRVRLDGTVTTWNFTGEVVVTDIDRNGLAGKTDEEWLELACTVAGRDLTPEEWAEYVPGDEAPESACS